MTKNDALLKALAVFDALAYLTASPESRRNWKEDREKQMGNLLAESLMDAARKIGWREP